MVGHYRNLALEWEDILEKTWLNLFEGIPPELYEICPFGYKMHCL